MACFSPLTAYRNPAGGKPLFSRRDSAGMELKLPCGQCIGCRLEYSRVWAVRITHEASLHDQNCFVTLTYDDVHLPQNNTLVYRDLQLFIKRLRKSLSPRKIRYYGAGEYGDQSGRAHYHVCLFGWRPGDLKYYSANKGNPLYTSDYLSDIWGLGYVTVGDVTFDSAAYVARYVVKKFKGNGVDDKLIIDCDDDGVLNMRAPERALMSRRPGIGRNWIDQYGKYTYDHDHVIVNGRPVLPPRYYDTVYEITDVDKVEFVKRERRKNARTRKSDSTDARLRVRAQVKLAELNSLTRLL
ncbi:MAG: replication initiator protein [Microviridae sp.]|nr:MAG: replication initiator protein [Microviridae sp.]